MPKKKYLVTLRDDEREQLEQLLHSGTHATRKVTRARMLLKAAEGWEDNAEQATIDWRFSVTDAREKLKRLYPSLSS